MIQDKNQKKQYWSPGVTVDVVIFTVVDKTLNALLIKRSIKPFLGLPALPGGFLRKGETSRKAVERVVAEKAGVKNINDIYLEQLYTFDELDRDPRGQILSISYFALVDSASIKSSGNWLSAKNLPRLAFDHKKIIDYAIRRLGNKLEYTNVVLSLLPKKFAFSQLQETYEIILGKRLDKRNFRKKFLSLGLIRPIKELLTGGRQRPAQLYSFISQKPAELENFIKG